jgi:P-type conjugative transfer protein TrbG
MKRVFAALSIFWLLPALAADLVVPAIDPTAPVIASTPRPGELPEGIPLNMLSGRDLQLSPTQRQSVALSKQWMTTGTPPAAGENGAVIFTYGAALPTVVCSPLHVCDVALEPGETINDIHNGDRVRWKVYPAVTGTGPTKTTHLIIKATDTALATNLNIATDRRTYVIQLVSRKDDWMPLSSFAYPEDPQAQWAQYQEAQAKKAEATVLSTGENISTLDFNFRMKGDNVSWRPLRIYSNGSKTYVQFPASIVHGDLPTLVALGSHDKTEQLVNYRMLGDRFEVDKLLTHAALIRGVGRHQERVEILYDGKP